MDNERTPTTTGSAGRRHGHGRRLITGGLAALAGAATLVTATVSATPASAATVNGAATIASPGTTTPLTSGGSAAQFTVSLPAQAVCSGDTATHGYHVYSYLVHKGVAVSGIAFVGSPSSGLGLFDPTGTYYGPVNTAIGTGQIVGIPNNFEWAPIISKSYLPLTGSTGLLYTGSGASASGIWETGLACANTSGALVDNWNTEVTFHAMSTDANGFSWTAGAPAGLAITTASLPTAKTGVVYTAQLAATGATTAVKWTTNVKLPKGLKFNKKTGAITGTPSTKDTPGSFPITFTVTDKAKPTKHTASTTLTLTLSA
jgi:hypothetical protein